MAADTIAEQPAFLHCHDMGADLTMDLCRLCIMRGASSTSGSASNLLLVSMTKRYKHPDHSD